MFTTIKNNLRVLTILCLASAPLLSGCDNAGSASDSATNSEVAQKRSFEAVSAEDKFEDYGVKLTKPLGKIELDPEDPYAELHFSRHPDVKIDLQVDLLDDQGNYFATGWVDLASEDEGVLYLDLWDFDIETSYVTAYAQIHMVEGDPSVGGGFFFRYHVES